MDGAKLRFILATAIVFTGFTMIITAVNVPVSRMRAVIPSSMATSTTTSQAPATVPRIPADMPAVGGNLPIVPPTSQGGTPVSTVATGPPTSASRPPATTNPMSRSIGFGCASALAYLRDHQAPGFTDVCAPHSAHGRYGMTCWDYPPYCGTNTKVIDIACPDPVVYQNEASNSFAIQEEGKIDPYGNRPTVGYAVCDAMS